MNVKERIIKELKKVKRKGIESFINYLNQTGFFESPASTRFHGNYEGGLAEHSYSVLETVRVLNRLCKTKIPDESLIIAAISHDICKIGIYQKEEDEWGRDDQFPIGHGEKSIIILQKFIRLTDTEKILIRWHMGAYDPSLRVYQKYLQKHYPFYKLLYFADDISTSFLEETK